MLLPNLSQLWLDYRYPVQDGSQIALQHRQLVHNAWDAKRHRDARETIAKQEMVLVKQGQLSTLGEVSTALAHELNQPLATIANYVAACEMRVKSQGYDDPILEEALSNARKQAMRAGEVVQSIRNYLKRRPNVTAGVEIEEILNELKPILLMSANEHQTKLTIEAEKHLSEGAYFLDLGGYSSRPGAEHVSEKEEAARVLPAVKALANEFPEAFISVDTFRSGVAQKSVNEGAHLINDISAGQLDERMFETMAQLQVPYILMHLKGTPQTMQSLANYTNLVPEVLSYFTEKLTQLKQLGANQLIIDPGFGFAKTLEHNYELLNRFQELHALGLPVLAGVSRKSMIYKALDCTPTEALNGTTVLHTIALQKGAHILRVHDVKPAIEAIKLVAKLQAN
jgi:dihydropteroate synthase